MDEERPIKKRNHNGKVREGEIYCNKNGQEFIILYWVGKGKHKVKFLSTGYESNVADYSIIRGWVKDRLLPTIRNIGKLGYARSRDNKRAYNVWFKMIDRCYNKNYKEYDYYGGKGTYVCERWLRFDFFLEDLPKIDGYDKELFENGYIYLDKDKKQFDLETGKVYSLSTCSFLTPRENTYYRKLSTGKEFRAINKDGDVFYGTSVLQFCKENNIYPAQVHRILSNKSGKTAKGWKFEYINKEENTLCNQ